MNPNEQLEQNNQATQVSQDNLNTEVVQPQQTVQPIQQDTPLQQPVNTAPVAKKPFVKKKKNKTLLIVLIAVIVLGAAYYFLTGKSVNGIKLPLGGNNQEKIKVDTGKKWGDVFALYLQDDFKKSLEVKDENDNIIEVERDIELAFIDFDYDDTPEMIVKYLDNAGLVTYRMFVYSNEEVSETKDFRNASFKIIYSLEEKEADWYIYISNGNKIGAYTKVSKILKGTAFDSDIKAYTDKEIAEYNKKYASTAYKLILYKIDEKTYADDFKLAVEKYADNNKEIKEMKEKLINDYANVEIKEEVNINKDPNIQLGELTLDFGKYAYDRDIYENGSVVGTEKVYITINRDWTATIEGKSVKYNIYGTAISLENGLMIKAVENNKFSYGVGVGNVYTFVE